jgi:hypothetical protein
MRESDEDVGCVESTRIAATQLLGGDRKISLRLSREVTLNLSVELGRDRRRKLELEVLRTDSPFAGHRFPRVSEPRTWTSRENDSEEALVDSLLDFPMDLHYQHSLNERDFERYDVFVTGLAPGELGEKYFECPPSRTHP